MQMLPRKPIPGCLRGWSWPSRLLLFVVFAGYGSIKLLGGQYDYGDWVISNRTADGTSVVWAFYGYSPVYGRFTGLYEVVPALLLLSRRTVTLGALGLFAVSLNITVMDFAYGYPMVKCFSLAYTLLCLFLVVPRPRTAARRLLAALRSRRGYATGAGVGCPVTVRRSAFGGHQARRCRELGVPGSRAAPSAGRTVRTSPGVQSSTSQIAVRVENRTALARLFFKTDRFTSVTPTRSASSVRVIPRSASNRSRWQTMRC